MAAVRERVAEGLAAEPRLPATGIEVVAVRVVALRPEPEVERALRTPAREQIQQDADRATYERRAVAVERERAIAENELASQIELARREEQLVDQRGTNARREAEEHAAADAVRAGAEAARTVRLAEAEATGRCASRRPRRAARCAWPAPRRRRRARSARRAPRRRRPGCGCTARWTSATLHALTGTRLAENLPRIDSVTVSPDVLTGLLARLGGTADGERA